MRFPLGFIKRWSWFRFFSLLYAIPFRFGHASPSCILILLQKNIKLLNFPLTQWECHRNLHWDTTMNAENKWKMQNKFLSSFIFSHSCTHSHSLNECISHFVGHCDGRGWAPTVTNAIKDDYWADAWKIWCTFCKLYSHTQAHTETHK